MYSDLADESFFNAQKNTLRNWHEQDPSDSYEIIRTWEIAEYQQNKPNPFILDETLIDRAYFYNGIMLGDMNGDGVINIVDVVLLVNNVLNGSYSLTGDMNQDDNLNIIDIVWLVNTLLTGG